MIGRWQGASGRSDRHIRSSRKTPSEGITALFVRWVKNRSHGRPWAVAEHTRALVACVVVLGSPPSHIYLIVIIRLCERAILVRLHREVASSGSRWSSCKPVVLVTLGGCHLLDGLVVVSVEARKKLVRRSGEVLCEGYLCSPCGSREEQL